MEPRRSHLSAAELVKCSRRPLYFLLIQSREIRSEQDFRPPVRAQGYATIQAIPVGAKGRKASKQALAAVLVHVPGAGEFIHHSDGVGNRAGDEFLYLFLHRRDAEFYLDQSERKNRCALNGMRHFIQETLGDVQFE